MFREQETAKDVSSSSNFESQLDTAFVVQAITQERLQTIRKSAEFFQEISGNSPTELQLKSLDNYLPDAIRYVENFITKIGLTPDRSPVSILQTSQEYADGFGDSFLRSLSINFSHFLTDNKKKFDPEAFSALIVHELFHINGSWKAEETPYGYRPTQLGMSHGDLGQFDYGSVLEELGATLFEAKFLEQRGRRIYPVSAEITVTPQEIGSDYFKELHLIVKKISEFESCPPVFYFDGKTKIQDELIKTSFPSLGLSTAKTVCYRRPIYSDYAGIWRQADFINSMIKEDLSAPSLSQLLFKAHFTGSYDEFASRVNDQYGDSAFEFLTTLGLYTASGIDTSSTSLLSIALFYNFFKATALPISEQITVRSSLLDIARDIRMRKRDESPFSKCCSHNLYNLEEF